MVNQCFQLLHPFQMWFNNNHTPAQAQWSQRLFLGWLSIMQYMLMLQNMSKLPKQNSTFKCKSSELDYWSEEWIALTLESKPFPYIWKQLSLMRRTISEAIICKREFSDKLLSTIINKGLFTNYSTQYSRICSDNLTKPHWYNKACLEQL